MAPLLSLKLEAMRHRRIRRLTGLALSDEAAVAMRCLGLVLAKIFCRLRAPAEPCEKALDARKCLWQCLMVSLVGSRGRPTCLERQSCDPATRVPSNCLGSSICPRIVLTRSTGGHLKDTSAERRS